LRNRIPAVVGTEAQGGGRLPYEPSMDGLRAAAVSGVLAFHQGFGWARGGFLGVSTFSTLSGFLITSLLVRE
jgi:peptidoglycan/LPS O-acetylase OafA/YrhL